MRKGLCRAAHEIFRHCILQIAIASHIKMLFQGGLCLIAHEHVCYNSSDNDVHGNFY